MVKYKRGNEGGAKLQLNSIILEGNFKHFTSKKGDLPMKFLMDCDGDDFTISIPNSKMAEMVTTKKPKRMRIVGRLSRSGKAVMVTAEHIEFKPKK